MKKAPLKTCHKSPQMQYLRAFVFLAIYQFITTNFKLAAKKGASKNEAPHNHNTCHLLFIQYCKRSSAVCLMFFFRARHVIGAMVHKLGFTITF